MDSNKTKEDDVIVVCTNCKETKLVGTVVCTNCGEVSF